MRKETIHHIIGIALGALMLPLLWVSCTNEDGEDIIGETDTTPVRMGLTISTRTIQSDSYTYEQGSTYENYIDIAGGDYRIYFFDSDKKYVARFEPDGFVALDDGEYTKYRVLGDVPYTLGNLDGNFTIMVLANWGSDSYNDDALIAGTTTIDDVCSAEWSQYTHKENFELGPDNLMPFFGIRKYENVTFKSDVATILNDEPVLMLRAMAKIEVVLEPGDNLPSTLTDVRICNYNDKGYCAPEKVYSQDDYYDGEWSDDFTNSIHLVNGSNDTGSKELSFRKVQEYVSKDELGTDGDQLETWVAYVPEYDNVTSQDDYSYIAVKYNYNNKGEQGPYNVYFANYTNGNTDNTVVDNRYDIMRNYLYRFKVTVDNVLTVKTNIWEDEWENNFEFGSTTNY